MEPDEDKKTSIHTEDSPSSGEPQAPADALSRTPEDLEQEQAEQAAATSSSGDGENQTGEKKLSPFKQFLRKVNVYFLFFLLIVVVAGAITIVNYLNSQKTPPEATIETQQLTEEALKQLANTDVSVGSASQTLTIQGNAIISGQTLMRGNLNVAGNFQTGGSIQGPNLTISGTSNLGTAQINSLQVAQNVAIQGNTTVRDLSVSGTSNFAGAVTASQLTVSRLTLSGNGILQIPNHLSFTGPTPSHSAGGALGNGGTTSISGSDTSGTININTGSGTAAGCFIRINFRQEFASQPRVIVSPIGNGAGQSQYYVDRNTSGFSVCTASPAPANQVFGFDYFVAG